jgi:hypothetical protein
LGWATAPRTWVEVGKSVRQASPGYGEDGSFTLLLATYGFVLALLSIGAGEQAEREQEDDEAGAPAR